MKDSGCDILETTRWGRKRLAYEIKKRNDGYYIVHVFEGDRNFISALDRELRLNPEVIRHLLVTVKLTEQDKERMRRRREEKIAAQAQAEEAEKSSEGESFSEDSENGDRAVKVESSMESSEEMNKDDVKKEIQGDSEKDDAVLNTENEKPADETEVEEK